MERKTVVNFAFAFKNFYAGEPRTLRARLGKKFLSRWRKVKENIVR